MSEFPRAFSENPQLLTQDMFTDPRGHLAALNHQGFEIQLGMTPEDLAGIQLLAEQESIRTFCLNDLSPHRFQDRMTTEEWLKKGRLVFLLKKLGAIAGYGWSGPGKTDLIPIGDTTAAVRLSEEHQGKGLATPFLGIIGDYTLEAFPDSHIWIEAWRSNEAGVHVDKKVGYKVVESIDDKRLTPSGEKVDDTRLYMQLDDAA